MARYAALLRGINLGPHKKVSMPALREVLEGLGFDDVQTLLQSGNAVFTASKPDTKKVEAAIAERFGFDVKVLLRTHADLKRIVNENPFPDAAADGRALHVTFLSAKPATERIDAIDPELFAPDQVAFGKGPEMYVWYQNGMARSNVGKYVTERKLGVVASDRNWNTVTKLLELTGR